MTTVDIVIVTRDRRDRLLATLEALRAAGPGAITVVDNASVDGTADAVGAAFPDVGVVRLPANLGAAARNAGVALSGAPYVAFCDDDSWWLPGSLPRAASEFDAHPRLGLLAARVIVLPGGRIDPVCAAMAASPLCERGGLGPAVLGFLACGAVVRRSAFLAAGGFSLRYGIGGEEELLALDLRRQGWQLSYCDDVVACHQPVASVPVAGQAWRDPAPRRRRQTRNALWTAWLRRPVLSAAGVTVRTLAGARQAPVRQGLVDAAAEWRWVLTERRPVPPGIEADLRLLGRSRLAGS